MTPLEYAISLGRSNLVKIFCLHLKKNPFSLTKKEFHLLLSADYHYAQDALTEISTKPKVSNIPSFKKETGEIYIINARDQFEIVKILADENITLAKQTKSIKFYF